MKRSGFTLIELSIVLVIIALIVGGILTGRMLIENATLRKLTKQIEAYTTAVHTFRQKYNCQPGDCPNATNFWGTRSKTCAGGGALDGVGYDVYDVPTCNGNNNGMLLFTSGNEGRASDSLFFWQHLSNAELIAGKYTGINSGTFYGAVAGVNVPKEFRDAGTYLLTNTTTYQHQYYIGAIGASGYPSEPAFTVSELQSLDNKLDDGLPYDGRVQNSYFPGWVANRCGVLITAGTTYKLDAEGTVCNMVWQGAWF